MCFKEPNKSIKSFYNFVAKNAEDILTIYPYLLGFDRFT